MLYIITQFKDSIYIDLLYVYCILTIVYMNQIYIRQKLMFVYSNYIFTSYIIYIKYIIK